MTMPNDDAARRSALLLIAACLLAVQLALLAVSMPLSKVLSGEHSYYIDNPYHVYQLEGGRELLGQGRLTGYDTTLGGGHLGGANENLSARGAVMLAAVLPSSLPAGQVYTLYVLICALCGPLAVAVLAGLLRWPARTAALASMLGLVFWWVGALRWYHTAGMVSFVFCCYMGLPYAAWVWQLCGAPMARARLAAGLAGAGLLGGLGIWLHPLFPVIAGLAFIGYAAGSGERPALPRLLLRGAAVAAIALLVNLPWLAVLQGQRDVSANVLALHPYQKAVGLLFALKPALGIWGADSQGIPLNPLLLLACAAGAYFLPAAQRRRMLPLLLGGLLLLAFASFGAAVPGLAQAQPNRFVAPAFLCIALAGAYCVGAGVPWLRSAGGRYLKIGLALAAGAVLLYACRETLREATPGPHGHYGPSAAELGGQPRAVAELVDWLRANTTAQGRIAFETSLGRVHGGGHVAGLVALKSGRELIGAGYPFSLPEVSLWDRSVFGRPIAEVTPAQLWQGLDLYNVGWVAAHSPELQRAMAALPRARAVADIGPVRMYQLDRPLSFVAAGQARIAGRGVNRLELAGAAGGELVLRYHWLPGLVASNGAVLEPAPSAPGFPPFIRVRNPPASFTVSLGR
ncbi:hypothetical protein ASD15_20680 [Massilia sp. Root351]|uniref:hypothetical protein n=1 Tax=Massilia sp. Root351 TaxID=1736522 RepID=UPI00070897A3|nr:hypothetical protein [Massilia sp. Root351]KQV79082.1 hypothetical protein ASD15_20680 [Massilia sp. Root351]